MMEPDDNYYEIEEDHDPIDIPELLHPWRVTGIDWLDQDEVWIDREGVVWKLRDMTSTHVRNVLRFILRRAKQYHESMGNRYFRWLGGPHGDVAFDMLERIADEHDDLEPGAWVRRSQLVYGLHHELQRRRRHIYALQESGRAPFEVAP